MYARFTLRCADGSLFSPELYCLTALEELQENGAIWGCH
jgi:hypothetical protein